MTDLERVEALLNHAELCENAPEDAQWQLIMEAGRMVFMGDDAAMSRLKLSQMTSVYAFESAALLLVPDGWAFARLAQGDNKSWWVELRRGFITSYSTVVLVPSYKGREPPFSGVSTLGLAITAAACRAWAAQLG